MTIGGASTTAEGIKPVPERKISEVKEEPDWRVSKNSNEDDRHEPKKWEHEEHG